MMHDNALVVRRYSPFPTLPPAGEELTFPLPPGEGLREGVWLSLIRAASTAALLALFLFLPAAYAADFGRLFFTPQQRAQLDYEYARSITADGDTGSVVMVNGIVQRHGGGRTVWINGKAQPAGKSDERHPTSVPVSIPGKTKPVEMKVGQKLLLDTPDTTPDAPAKPPAP